MLTSKPYYTPSLKDHKYIRVSTEKILHKSESVNYGKPIELEYYLVRCLKCDKDCETANIIDGEQKNGTIMEPVISLWSAKCKKCLGEWFF